MKLIRKGIVSTVNTIERKARVIFQELNNRISPELIIAKYVGDVNVNDIVVVSFYNDDVSEGLIIANLSNNANNVQPGDNNTYTHNQLSATTEWIIKHDLNKYPNVTVVDSAGSVVIGDITYISENEVRVNFTAAFLGKAYLN